MKSDDNQIRTVKRKKDGLAKRLWRRIRGPLAQSAIFKAVLVWLIAAYFKLVYYTNPRLKGSADPQALVGKDDPFIVTFGMASISWDRSYAPKGSNWLPCFPAARTRN